MSGENTTREIGQCLVSFFGIDVESAYGHQLANIDESLLMCDYLVLAKVERFCRYWCKPGFVKTKEKGSEVLPTQQSLW